MKNILAKNIGKNIKKALNDNNMTQTELADVLKISKGQMSFVIKGERPLSIEAINKISDMFGISVEDLFLKDIEDKEGKLLKENADIGINIDELLYEDVKFLNLLISSFEERNLNTEEQ